MSETFAVSRASLQAPLSFTSNLPTSGYANIEGSGFLDMYQVLSELPSGLLVVAVPSGKPLFYNEQAAHLLRLPIWSETATAETEGSAAAILEAAAVKHALQGMSRFDAPPYAAENHPLARAAQNGETIHQEEVWLSGAGNTRLCLALNAAPILNAQSEVVAIACTFDDITARKTSEAEIERQNEHLQDTMESLQVAQEDLLMMCSVVEGEKQRYQELFEAATDGYITTDLNGIIDEVNHAAIQRLGLSPSYVVGRILTNYVALEDRTRFRSFLSRLVQEIEAPSSETTEWEGRFTPRGSLPFDAILTVSRAQGMEEESACLRWILRDITQRKQMEQARADDQERLLEQERRAGVLEERNRIAQEFHDTLAQGFTGISFLLAAAEGAVTDAPEKARAQIARARQVATECIAEARRSIHDLRSRTLANSTLPVALAHVVEQARTQTNAEIDFQVQGVPLYLPVQVENDLLRIGQEAVTNALKHANAAHISVQLAFTLDQVQINIIDDGKGLPDKTLNAGTGYGLIGIRERTQRIGGQFTLGSEAGKGTRIHVTVPLLTQTAPV